MSKVRNRDTGFTHQNSLASLCGYTIVETMIFLAVSGGLFLSAMLLINGQQRKTEFTTSVRDFDSKLQSVIGNVASGYYNNPGTITCDVMIIAGIRTPNPTSGVSNQGQNHDCTFIGQYIELPTSDKFTITSYAGLRLNDAGKEVQSLAEAVPTPITDTAEGYSLLSGVTATMKIVGGSIIDRLAITTTFNQHDGAGIIGSGSSRVEIYAREDVSGIDVVNPPSGVQICLDGGDQVGIIVLNTGSTRVSIGNSCP